MKTYNLVTVLGATASGKTGVAVHLAKRLNGEIISADSRQVYRGMNIGTGKDIAEYTLDGIEVPYHLIDIVDAGYEYNVFEYQRDFVSAFEKIQTAGKLPIVCGGTGMYIEAVLKGYKLINVPVNEPLRKSLEEKTLSELETILNTYKTPHNKTDVDTVKRAVRAIEIEEYYTKNTAIDRTYPTINSLIVGVKFDRDSRRKRITERLESRMKEGMIAEVNTLLENGVKPEQLIYYGLEYKFLTQFVLGQLSYNEMFKQLETAIHQFSKRQMTWYRRMEKQGFDIRWIDGYLPMEKKMQMIEDWFSSTAK
ncbi:MAG: tRNA (adenosine(37)-N6)-dimethylallyltransferase MiaA [Prolixibacteraceae bacterium]|jgi:tRNA dimethylallyltransferase|nr:tRNA (adenosine(37)-N6)-dimethylallyltransferase MiaA [Prolixibacteraceae bacterium]